MRSASLMFIALLFLISATRPLGAQTPEDAATQPKAVPADDQERVHQALVKVREAIVRSVNSQDVEALLPHLHPDVVVVWQNAEISRGRDGVRKYYNENLGGPDAVLESYTIEPTVSERTALYGDDMGIAYGMILCHFKFKNGRQFDLNGPWSATLVLDEGSWQIASFHGSSGLFDNPLLLQMQNWLVWGCIGAGAGGMAIGAVLMLWIKRRKPV